MSKILVRASLRNKLGSQFESYMQTLHKFLENPRAHGFNLEKLNTTASKQKIYSIRHSQKSRIILCLVESNEGQVWVVTDVLPTHKYDALTPLSHDEQMALMASFTPTSSSVNDNNNNNNNPATEVLIRDAINIEFFNNQFILLDDEQLDARTKGMTSLPLIISGAPGSGKTSVLLSIVKQNMISVGQGSEFPRILIIAKSTNLIRQLEKEWISICNVEFKDMNIDINSVEFKTPEEIYIQNHGVTNFKGEQDFISWYSHYAATQKKLNNGETLLVGVNEAHLIYQEFYTMSGYQNFEEYDAHVSSKFSLFFDRQTRALLWQLYEAYRKKLTDDKEVDLAFQPIELTQTYHFIGIDETQDLSRQEIKSLVHQKASDNFIFCVGDHQRLFGSETTLPFLRSIFWKKHQKDVTTHKVLHASYRCPQAVIQVANAVLKLKAKATGDFDKNDIPHVRSLHESDLTGSVHWLEKEEELTPMINDRNNAHFIVITSPEFMPEAGELFGPERVFTAIAMKGLQAKHVLLYRFLDQEGFKVANPIIGDDFHLEDTAVTSKTSDGSIRHSTIFNEFFVATTRAEMSLSIYQPPIRSIRFLCEPLKTFMVEHNKEKTHAQSIPTNSTAEEWQILVDQLRAEGQYSQAQAIIDRHLRTALNQEQYPEPKNEKTSTEQTKSETENKPKKATKKKSAQHPIEKVLLDQPEAMENLLKDSNARDYLFNIPLNIINAAWPECSLMEYLNKPEQAKMKELLDRALIHSLSKICSLKKLTREQQAQQDALIGILFYQTSKSSLPLVILLRSQFTPEQCVFIKEYKQRRLNQLNEQIVRGDIEAIASLKYLELLNTLNKEGLAPIHVAANAGETEVIAELKKAGTDIDFFDKSGGTALCYAVIEGNLKIVAALLKSGADVNKPNASGLCPLHVALGAGNKFGPVNATQGAHVKVFNHLLKQKNVEIDKLDEFGRTPLHHAANNKQVDAIQVLISLGANVNIVDQNGHTPLHLAVLSGNLALIKALLCKQGIDIDKRDKNGLTPLMIAIKKGYVEVSKALIDLGADVNITDDDGLATLHAAAAKDSVELIHKLIKAGANPNVVDREGNKPLHTAAYFGSVNAIMTLIKEYGVDVNSSCNENATPLFLAVSEGRVKTVSCLLSENASCFKPYQFKKSAEFASLLDWIQKTGGSQDKVARAEALMKRKGIPVDAESFSILPYEFAHIMGFKTIEKLLLDKMGHRYSFFNNNNNSIPTDSSNLNTSTVDPSNANISSSSEM